MRKYELLLVLPGTLDEKEAEKRAEEVRANIKGFGEESNFHLLGKNRLAYPIKHIRYGYFYSITFECETVKLKELETKLSLERDLLRAIISLYNPKLSSANKISYSIDSMGVTNIVENDNDNKEVETKEEEKISVPEAKKVDLKDIDKKLDEILQGDIIPQI